MCMLTYYPPNAEVDTDALLNGTEWNRDGHGYAIVVPGKKPKLIVKHGLDANTLIWQFANDRKNNPHGPALFHSRFGTSGSGGKFNCHPFTLNGDKMTVVAHNGVLPRSMQPSKGDTRCDTHMAADELFGRAYGHLSTDDARAMLAMAIGTNNKLVILTINPEFDSYSYIVNEESGTWDNGVWYSNYDYIGRKWVSDKKVEFDPFDADCDLCGSFGSVDIYAICSMCDSCVDCSELADDCLCYTGEEVAEVADKENEWLQWLRLEEIEERKSA